MTEKDYSIYDPALQKILREKDAEIAELLENQKPERTDIQRRQSAINGKGGGRPTNEEKFGRCDICGEIFNTEEFKNRHQPHEKDCQIGVECDCDYNVHEKCCEEKGSVYLATCFDK